MMVLSMVRSVVSFRMSARNLVSLALSLRKTPRIPGRHIRSSCLRPAAQLEPSATRESSALRGKRVLLACGSPHGRIARRLEGAEHRILENHFAIVEHRAIDPDVEPILRRLDDPFLPQRQFG